MDTQNLGPGLHPQAQQTLDFNDRAAQSFSNSNAQQWAGTAPQMPAGSSQEAVAASGHGHMPAVQGQPQMGAQQLRPAAGEQIWHQAPTQRVNAFPATSGSLEQVDAMSLQPEQQPLGPGVEDFFLMDVVGGGCAEQGGGTLASKCVAVLHPTKPVVAYSAGCMIIVYDLMSDSKVNLVGHQHDVHAVAFTPSGDSLMSVDFNRNAELQDNLNTQGGLAQEPTSQICLWDWQRGACIQDATIPRSQNLSMILAPSVAAGGMSQIGQADGAGGVFASGAGGRLGALTGQDSASQSSCHIQLCFDKSGTLFMVLESSPLEIGGGYRVTLWSFNKQQVMEMISSMDLELQCPCLDLCFLPRTQSDVLNAQRSAGHSSHSAQVFLNSKLPFMTVERQCIKMWEYSQGNAQLKKRIHIKQNISSIQISELTGFFLILGENGKVLILDQQGEFVSTISKEGIVFTKIGTAHDKLLLGTNRGTLHVYHMASLQFISEVPYQLSFLEKFSLNSASKNMGEVEQLSLHKVGPPVAQIGTTQNLRFLWIKYQDASFVVVDRTILNPRQAILGFSCGHFEAISGLQWVQPRSSVDLVSRPGGFTNLSDRSALVGLLGREPGFSGQATHQGTHDQQFVTCSHDLSVHIWRHYGDRWAFSYIDVAKSFDQALSFQRKQCDRSTRELQLTAVCLYPRSNNLVVGDSKGFVRVFQLVNENSHLIGTYRLPRSHEVKAERALGISPNSMASRLGVDSAGHEDQLKEIYITQNEQTAVITFNSGLISLYDAKNSYSWIGDAVDQDFAKFNTQQSSGLGSSTHTIVLEVTKTLNNGQFNASLRDRMQMYGQGAAVQQDEQPSHSFAPPLAELNHGRRTSSLSSVQHGAHASNMKILSLQTPNQVSMQLIDIKGTKLTRSLLCQYVISDGKVTGFDLHPSNDYLLVTSSKGRIYVFRIDTGELRGTIRTPLNASGCQIDPSGLYVIVKVPAFANLNTMNLAAVGGAQITNQVGHFGANEKDLARNTILMYEIGTGVPAAEICSVFEITEMKFSCDGRYLALGSTSGAISVWSMGNHLYQNIKQVQDAMKLSNDFWFNYPIFLPDYEQFNQVAADPQFSLPQDDYQHAAQQQMAMNAPEYQPENSRIRPPQRLVAHPNPMQADNRDHFEIQPGESRDGFVNHGQLQQPAPGWNQETFHSHEYSQMPPQHSQQQQQWVQPGLSPSYRLPQTNAPQVHRPYPISAAGNESRFLRKQFGESQRPFAAQRANQMLGPSAIPGNPRGGAQGASPDGQTQAQRQAFLNSQMNYNSGLYQGAGGNPASMIPPSYPPLQQQFSQSLGIGQENCPYQQPNQQTLFQGQQYPLQGQPQALSAPPSGQLPNPYQDHGGSGSVHGAGAPHWHHPAEQKQPAPLIQNPVIPFYPPVQANQQQPIAGQSYRNETHCPLVTNQGHAEGTGFTQQLAAATLLDAAAQRNANAERSAHKAGGVDLGEPVPFNQSQLLYNQPLNATINGPESLTKDKTFIRYADMGEGQRLQGENRQSNTLAKPHALGGNQGSSARGGFDRSLNDREGGTTWAPEQIYQGGAQLQTQQQQQHMNLHYQQHQQQQQMHLQYHQQQQQQMQQQYNQLQQHMDTLGTPKQMNQRAAAQETWGHGQGTIQDEMHKLGVNQASPAKQEQQSPYKTELVAQTLSGKAAQGTTGAGDSAQFGEGTVNEGTPQLNTVQKQEADPREFRPFGFSNTLTQQDILQAGKTGGLRADPADIDGGPKTGQVQVKAAGIAGTPGDSMTQQMLQELDGTNKYLQGVRVPQAMLRQAAQPGHQGYTLQQLRQEERHLNYQREVQAPISKTRLSQLYQAGAPTGPGNQVNLSGGLASVAPGYVQQQRVADLPPALASSDTHNSQVKGSKASNYDMVDEMYQSIDDFEEKLARMRIK